MKLNIHKIIKDHGILFIIFTVLWIHASWLGLSDDEAYYWVLSQTPAWGYAFHPPAVAWVIALFDRPLSVLFGGSHSGIVRLPAVLGTVLILGLALEWIRKQGLSHEPAHEPAQEPDSLPVLNDKRSLAVLLSFFGLFSLSWMMVPDIPLLVSWTGMFYLNWNICFEGEKRRGAFVGLGFCAALALLSKFSGVMPIASSLVSIWIWVPQKSNTTDGKKKATMALILGGALALLPILIWNSQHEWGSLLYQFHDRHSGGEISWKRYARFWLVEILLVGPVAIFFGLHLLKKSLFERRTLNRNDWFVGVWIAPALVYLIQPLFSDFKPHWAFIIWWPLIILMAVYSHQNRYWKWIKFQVYYGISLGLFILISCHLPISGWVMQKVSKYDSRWDVTNDFYGWRDLGPWLKTELDEKDRDLPLIGSRYQTASQIYFNLGQKNRATLLPRDVKEKDEWPELGVSETWGPEWPKLIAPVLFIGDNRYTAAPEFKSARCNVLKKFEFKRWGMLAKSFDIWKCEPI